MRWLTVLLLLVAVAACDRKPAHYYVLCEGLDGAGWHLVGTEYEEGYLMACTYQSPDKRNIYTVRCSDRGCD
jgi:hypothetical protein